jgi:MoaA/NifB/PqqE/SkfB family radical SAM enzyme
MTKDNFECSAVLNGIEIELTNYCWLDCSSCIRKQSQNFWFLEFDTLKNIINFSVDRWDKEIVLSGLWDVFLHKDLYKYIEYIFERLPKSQVYIMTKWQEVTLEDIEKIKEFNNKWYNLNITYSIYSLHPKKYTKLTWGWKLDDIINAIKLSHKYNINFNFEFLLSNSNVSEIDHYKDFSKLFWKSFHYSIPHNWGGTLDKAIYKEIFNNDILWNYIDDLASNDKCIAFTSEYLFFTYSWEIHKCSIARWSRKFYLWDINKDSKISKSISELNYKNCNSCTYSKYKTKL